MYALFRQIKRGEICLRLLCDFISINLQMHCEWDEAYSSGRERNPLEWSNELEYDFVLRPSLKMDLNESTINSNSLSTQPQS